MFGNHTPTGEVTHKPGRQWKFKFDNGFGASVINDGYGSESGLYEVGVLGPDGRLTYESPVTDDVLGYLTPDEVTATLDAIAALTLADIEAAIIRRADEKVADICADRDRRIAKLRAEATR